MFEKFVRIWLAASALLIFYEVNKYIIYSLNADYSGYFSFGTSVYFVLRHGFTRARGALVMFSIFMMHFQGVLEASRIESSAGLPHSAEWLILFNSIVVMGFFCVLFKTIPLGKFGAVATALGLVSYPLHLLHALIGYVFLDRFLDDANEYLIIPLCVVTVFLMSCALTYMWERPVLNALRPWVYKILRAD